MTAERNDLMPNQKLEWVTPKISMMEADDTEGSGKPRLNPIETAPLPAGAAPS
jgi:hypothetical protein